MAASARSSLSGRELVSFDTAAAVEADKETRRQGDKESANGKGNGSACLPLSMSSNSLPPLVQQAVSPGEIPHCSAAG